MGCDSGEQSVASRHRQRLLALRAAQEFEEEEDEAEPQQQEMKFRNYVPHGKNVQEEKLAPAVLPKFEDPVDAVPPPEPGAKEKPNWDVRRDARKKLDKLTREANSESSLSTHGGTREAKSIN